MPHVEMRGYGPATGFLGYGVQYVGVSTEPASLLQAQKVCSRGDLFLSPAPASPCSCQHASTLLLACTYPIPAPARAVVARSPLPDSLLQLLMLRALPEETQS